MQLPLGQRSDLLDFIGSTPVADSELRRIIARCFEGEFPDTPRAA